MSHCDFTLCIQRPIKIRRLQTFPSQDLLYSVAIYGREGRKADGSAPFAGGAAAPRAPKPVELHCIAPGGGRSIRAVAAGAAEDARAACGRQELVAGRAYCGCPDGNCRLRSRWAVISVLVGHARTCSGIWILDAQSPEITIASLDCSIFILWFPI